MSREAMQMALEALVQLDGIDTETECVTIDVDDVITALRQALEIEQEPVAFINVEKQKLEWAKLTSWHTPTIVNLPKIPLYTAPPKKEWVGLHGSEVPDPYKYDVMFNEGWWWAEEKLKEKNT